MIRTAPKPSLSKLIHELDGLVSEVVRRSAADERGTAVCISCECRRRWQDLQCCHFIPRSHMNTRFNLLNLNVACPECNCFDEPNHLAVWAEKLGPDMVSYLEREGRSLRKLMRFEVEKGIELMKAKLKELR